VCTGLKLISASFQRMQGRARASLNSKRPMRTLLGPGTCISRKLCHVHDLSSKQAWILQRILLFVEETKHWLAQKFCQTTDCFDAKYAPFGVPAGQWKYAAPCSSCLLYLDFPSFMFGFFSCSRRCVMSAAMAFVVIRSTT
jgi:hypothetical protein